MSRHSILRKGNSQLVNRLTDMHVKDRASFGKTALERLAKEYWIGIIQGKYTGYTDILKRYGRILISGGKAMCRRPWDESPDITSGFKAAIKELYGNPDKLTKMQLYQLYYLTGYFYDPYTERFNSWDAHACLIRLGLADRIGEIMVFVDRARYPNKQRRSNRGVSGFNFNVGGAYGRWTDVY